MHSNPSSSKLPSILVGTGGLLALFIWPLWIAIVNAMAFIVWTLLQLVSFWNLRNVSQQLIDSRPHQKQPVKQQGSDPFVSIHLAIHNEPPELVIDTLNALSRLSHVTFEVIVVDNNTTNPSAWLPVQTHCKSLGPCFHFHHRMGVIGAKAGALNIALELMSERATHIAVVDADYQVCSDFLQVAIEHMRETGTDYVQLPQSYRSVTGKQTTVENELNDYFHRHAQTAESAGAMLLTGTLSLIKAEALQRVGGWPTQTITEDAELALRFHRHGLSGSYLARRAGHGLLPPNLDELKGQRHRWIVGNVHCLIRELLWRVRHDAARPLTLSHWAQLSAWCSFVTIPSALMVLGSLLCATGLVSSQQWQNATLIAAVTVTGQALVTAGISRVTPGFFFVRWILAPSSGWATVSALGLQRSVFRCTRRENHPAARPSLRRTYTCLLICMAILCALNLGWFLVALALLLLVGTLACEYKLNSTLTHRLPEGSTAIDLKDYHEHATQRQHCNTNVQP